MLEHSLPSDDLASSGFEMGVGLCSKARDKKGELRLGRLCVAVVESSTAD
jgi:hypothetical protein